MLHIQKTSLSLSKQKIIEIMPIDTHTEHNPIAPWNQKETEPLTELEEQQEWNADLLKRNKEMKSQLQKLAEFEECIRTFGSLTYEQQTEKNEILNQYIK